MTTAAARALLSGVVDYAGLFPPAGLAMDEAVGEYSRWRHAPEGWLLGRFVVPSARLAELSRAALAHFPAAGAGEPWRLSALVGADADADVALVTSFNAEHRGWALVDTVELRAATAAEIAAALEALPLGLAAYVELAASPDLSAALGALAEKGARAKLRTGGVVPAAIPSTGDAAAFIAACAAAHVPFKATAGLHHALRARRPLTYAADSPRAVMHGFLNVLAAAAFAWNGAPQAQLEEVLREEDAGGLRLDDSGLAWRGLRVATETLERCRSVFAGSFGSCSFAEPLADLRALGLVA